MLTHALQFALLLAVFTNLTQHTAYMCWRYRRGSQFTSHWATFGPAYTVSAATFFIMVHPTYFVLVIGQKLPLMPASWRHSLQAVTAIGYVLLLVGTVWAAGLYPKFRKLVLADDCGV